MFHADNAYALKAARIHSRRLKTHTVSNTAFRGFGGPQGMVGIERALDRIAFETGLDPLDVRKRNFYPSFDSGSEPSLTPYRMAVDRLDHRRTDRRARSLVRLPRPARGDEGASTRRARS